MVNLFKKNLLLIAKISQKIFNKADTYKITAKK